MSVLHYGGAQIDVPMLCGAPWDRQAVTWRPYELMPDAPEKHEYLRDYEPCRKCFEILRETRPGNLPLEPTPSPKLARIAFLERKKLVTIEDCKVKLEAEDFHGVADAAMDLRDLMNELDGLRF